MCTCLSSDYFVVYCVSGDGCVFSAFDGLVLGLVPAFFYIGGGGLTLTKKKVRVNQKKTEGEDI